MIYFRQNEITINSPNDLKQCSYNELFEIWIDKRPVWKRPRYSETKVISVKAKKEQNEKAKRESENRQYNLLDRYGRK